MVANLVRHAVLFGSREELVEPATIVTERLRIEGQLSDLARFDIKEPDIPAAGRVNLLRGQEMDHVKIKPPLPEGTQTRFVPVGIEQNQWSQTVNCWAKK